MERGRCKKGGGSQSKGRLSKVYWSFEGDVGDYRGYWSYEDVENCRRN